MPRPLYKNPTYNLSESVGAQPAAPRALKKQYTTFSDGYLGSCNDEERSEMRYVMRIAEFSESSKL